MGEPQKQHQPGNNKRVSNLTLRADGAVTLGHHGVKTHLPGNVVGLEMEFDRSLLSFVIRYKARTQTGFEDRVTHTPLANAAQFDLAE